MVLFLFGIVLAQAGEVEIVNTDFIRQGEAWYVRTTLRRNDTGWEQYADAWRVVTENGSVLGTRVLYHSHRDE
jgi:hypothetical protein